MSLRRLLSVYLLVLFIASPAYGLSARDRSAILNDTVFYDESDQATSCTVDIDVSLNGSDNIEKAFRYFVQKGLTDKQSSGIIGNLQAESGMNPKQNQGGGGPGRGIAQWEVGGRWDVLLSFAKKEGRDPFSLELQLNFVWHELTERGYKAVLGNLKRTTDIADAMNQFLGPIRYDNSQPADPLYESRRKGGFENPGKPHAARRLKNAQQIQKLYAGTNNQAVDPAPDGNCQVTGSGQNSKFVEGFFVYSQYDPAWKDKPYGFTTIAKAGCAPSAMAMVITALTGRQVGPVETAQYAASNGGQSSLGGSNWTITPTLSAHWGLKAKNIKNDAAKIAAVIRGGGLIVTSGVGPKPFSTTGHYIVIRGVTASGKFKIGDSAHNDTSDQEWEPNQLLANMAPGNVWAVTK